MAKEKSVQNNGVSGAKPLTMFGCAVKSTQVGKPFEGAFEDSFTESSVRLDEAF